jgi:hypothetical protein
MENDMKLILGLTSAIFVLSLAGCGKSEYEPTKPLVKAKEYKIDPANLANLFPLAEGNTWTYVLESSTQRKGSEAVPGTSEFEYRVKTVVKESDSATRAILEVYRDGERRDEQEWLTDSTGIYQLSLGNDRKPFSPKQIVIKFPFKDGEMYTWEGDGPTPIGVRGHMKYSSKIDSMQPIDTDVAGEKMVGLFVENAGTFKTSEGEGILAQNTWFVPGVGLARYKQVLKLKDVEAVLTLRLKSYTVK